MLVVSFYTPDYAEHAGRLIASCRRAEQPYWIEPMDDAGTWVANCARKAAFLERALCSTSERGVLWVDADAEIMHHLWQLEETVKDASFAAYRETPDPGDPKLRIRSGTVWLAADPGGQALVGSWADRCRADPGSWDQMHLYHAWEDIRPVTRWLDIRYCQRVGRQDGEGIAAILHHQASRKMRNKKVEA